MQCTAAPACPHQLGGWGGVATPWVAIGKLDVTLLVLQFADHTNNNCSSSIGPGVWQGEVPTTPPQPKLCALGQKASTNDREIGDDE